MVDGGLDLLLDPWPWVLGSWDLFLDPWPFVQYTCRMKGFSHFTSAVAAATFIPGVVALAGHERSLILVLAGIFGLLPDWLDFKIARYFEPVDEHIEPPALNFDAQAIADQLAEVIHRAYGSDEPVTVQLYSARLGTDRWRKYSLQFDAKNAEHNQIIVRPGPTLNSAGVALEEIGQPGPVGQASLSPSLRPSDNAPMSVETLEGPSVEFRRLGEEVGISFLPWHRRWSHSLILAAIFGLAAGALFGGIAGWVVGIAFATHVLQDQLGHLGSNLWWPFSQQRSAGLKWMHAGDPLPNFVTVLVACGLILYNLNRFTTPPLYTGNVFLLWAVLVPASIALFFYAAGHRRQRPQPPEALSEVQETEVE